MKGLAFGLLAAAAAGCAMRPACVCSECGCGGDFVPEICTDEEKAEGFVPLYNGRDLSGWTLQGAQGCYRVGRCGELLFDHTVGGGNLWTDRDYSDFVIRFEFRLSSDCNNGLAVRTPFGKHAATDGLEIQMLDDEGAKVPTTDDLRKWTLPERAFCEAYHRGEKLIEGCAVVRCSADDRVLFNGMDAKGMIGRLS